MQHPLGVGDLAAAIYGRTGDLVPPSALSQCVYRGYIPSDLVATVAGRKVVDEQHLDAVIDALAHRGLIRREAGVA